MSAALKPKKEEEQEDLTYAGSVILDDLKKELADTSDSTIDLPLDLSSEDP